MRTQVWRHITHTNSRCGNACLYPDVHQEEGGRARRVPKNQWADILASAAQEQERLYLKEGENQQMAPKVVT